MSHKLCSIPKRVHTNIHVFRSKRWCGNLRRHASERTPEAAFARDFQKEG